MNILFLFVSLPHLSDEFGIFSSLIHEFKKNGHKVYVSAKGRNVNKTEIIIENDIPVLRIISHDFTAVSNNVKKALAYQEYAIKQRYYTKKFFKNEKIDLIISHSLPPELGYIVGGLKRHFKCPFYLIQSDFTWQDAVSFGYFKKNGPIALYYRFWEKRMFKAADYVGCPTVGNIDFIKQYYPWMPSSCFQFLPFWQKELEVSPNLQLKKEFGLIDKFTVVYGGSVGAAQRIEHIVELAEACKEYKDIVFLIFGRGAHLKVMKELVTEKGLCNVVFKDFLPQDQYLSFLASCDVGLIVLNEKMATPNFPSKSLSYFNMKVPILAALDYVTDFGCFLDENGIGKWAYSDDVKKLKERLMEYYDNPKLLNETGEKAYQFYKNVLQPKNAYDSIMKKVKQ